MVVEEYIYDGSSALAPSKQGVNPRRKEDLKRKQQKNKKYKKKAKQRSFLARVLRNDMTHIASVILVLGFVVIGRDAKVFKMQKQLSEVNTGIKALNSSNEALTVEILKANSLEKIETIARENLDMVHPTKDDMVKNVE